MWFKVHDGIRYFTKDADPEAVGGAFKAIMEYFVTGEEQTPAEDEKELYDVLRRQVDQSTAIAEMNKSGSRPRFLSYQMIALLYALMPGDTASRIIKSVTDGYMGVKTERLEGIEANVYSILTGGRAE